MITQEEFNKIELRVGTIIEASINKGTKKPAYKLKIDFGTEIGIKKSSAQITNVYQPEELIGKQVICVMNFQPIKISQIKSEVLVLGVDSENGVVLVTTDYHIDNGNKIY